MMLCSTNRQVLTIQISHNAACLKRKRKKEEEGNRIINRSDRFAGRCRCAVVMAGGGGCDKTEPIPHTARFMSEAANRSIGELKLAN